MLVVHLRERCGWGPVVLSTEYRVLSTGSLDVLVANNTFPEAGLLGGFMHPLTRFLNYLKRRHFAMALTREHLSDRNLTEWYPDWMYEVMETDEVRNQAYEEVIRETVSGKLVLEVGTGRKALWAVCCAREGAKRVYAVEANKRAFCAARQLLRSRRIDNVHVVRGFSDHALLSERCQVL